MCMYDIKLFAKKKKKEWESLIQALRICSQDAGMELGIEKCALRIMNRGKRQITEGKKN